MSESETQLSARKIWVLTANFAKWSTGRKAKWIIWIVVILAAKDSASASALYALDSQIKPFSMTIRPKLSGPLRSL